jgi:hypothetical protein
MNEAKTETAGTALPTASSRCTFPSARAALGFMRDRLPGRDEHNETGAAGLR